MVMLQSPIKSTDAAQTITAGNQLSPNSNPSSPKSNTLPDSDTATTAGSDCVNSTVMKVTNFNNLNNNNNNNNNINKNNNNTNKKDDDNTLIYSIERLKQMTDNGMLSPSTEEADGELDKKKNNRTQITTTATNTVATTNTNITPASNFINIQQRKLLELSKLARPEPLSPLQHSHAMLLQQHSHLLQHPQFLAAAAAQQQQQHHQLQQQHMSTHHLVGQHQQSPTFHLRAAISTLPPSPTNSPLSPPTSPPPPATHSSAAEAVPLLLAPTLLSHRQHPQQQQQQHSLQQQQLLSSSTPSSMLLSSQQQAVLTASSTPPTAAITTATSTTNDLDIERIKLVAAQAVAARSHAGCVISNLPLPPVPGLGGSAELSDYGFRIQLGGLAAAAAAAAATSRQMAAANYPRSDTSEELNVDGNDEDSNECSNGTPSVSFVFQADQKRSNYLEFILNIYSNDFKH